MRKVTYGAACSLDGYIAAADGAVDWLHFSADVQRFIAEFWQTIDTILMGRRTWEVTAHQMTNGGTANPEFQTYVFSQTLQSIEQAGVHLVRDNAAQFVRQLKQAPGKGICVMGGGMLGTSLIDQGVVDEVGLNVHPILLGSGVRLFCEMNQRVQLDLIECKAIEGDCILTTYKVHHPHANEANEL